MKVSKRKKYKFCKQCKKYRLPKSFSREHFKICRYCKPGEYRAIQAEEDYIGARLSSTEWSDRINGREFNLTKEDIELMWTTQEGKCYYTGISMSESKAKKLADWSIERLDNTKGHTKDNVVLCCLGINLMRQARPAEDLNEFLELIRSERP